MPKKPLFEAKKIRKRKKTFPVSKVRKLKRFLNRYISSFKKGFLVILVITATLYTYHVKDLSYFFRASVVDVSPEFIGTTKPVTYVPNWLTWGGDNHTTNYNSVAKEDLIELPVYDAEKLKISTESLEWGNVEHDKIRLAQLTFSVPYLGNYKLDGIEGGGSHPAVDIRIPNSTPIHAIANGIVIKTSEQSGGFGKHVVVKHDNVPDPDSPGKTTTLYSGYSHMSRVDISQGDIVEKGDVIGLSGESGFATTPHIHFDISTADSPFQPYWPFTSQEASDAGLSFTGAVNAGLGMENAKKYTVNPMLFVQQHENHDGQHDHQEDHQEPDNTEDTDQNDPNNESTDQQNENPDTQEPENNDEPVNENIDTSLFTFRITGESTSMVNAPAAIRITDEQNQLKNMSDTDEVKVDVSGVGWVSKKSFRKVDFKDGSVRVMVNSAEAGEALVRVGKSTFKVNFINEIKPTEGLRIRTDGYFQEGETEVIEIIALDGDGNPAAVANFPGTIGLTTKEGEAEFVESGLKEEDFEYGIARVQMIVKNPGPVVVYANAGWVEGESERIYHEEVPPFSDISINHPNYKAIKYLREEGVINGYPDGTFRANTEVNRAEALKMLMLAFDVKANSNAAVNFKDTESGAWYMDTLAAALEKGFVKGYEDNTFKPAKTVNTAEFLKMLFKTAGFDPPQDIVAKPYLDVSTQDWFAGYAYLANSKNIVESSDGNLNPGIGMNRGKVAEGIYRMMMMIEDNNLSTYSE